MHAKNRNIRLVSAGLIALFLLVALPAVAADGTVTVGYRGSGGAYLGDTIVFDGRNTAGTVTMIRITGPNLPAEGVPVNDLTAPAGTGTPVTVNPDGTWKFAWYTGSIKGAEKIITARYTILVSDQQNPEIASTTSVHLRKPEFSVKVSPATVARGEYVQITGIAENNVKAVRLEISDSAGRVTNAYDSTVSGTGYFNKGIHADLPPGTYTLTMSSPSVRTTSRTTLTVTGSSAEGTGAGDAPGTTPVSPGASAGTGSLVVTSTPLGATVFVNGIMLGTTPFSTSDLAAGTYLVEVKAPGYTTTSMTVEVLAGQTTTIGPSLVKGSGAAPVSALALLGGAALSFMLLVVLGRRQG